MFEVVFLGFEEGGGVAVDGDGGDFVALFDGVYDVLSFGDFAKDGVLAVEVGGGVVGDEELGAVGVRAGVCHGEDACFSVAELADEFIGKFVAWAASAGAGGVAALDHEVRDDAVELDSVVVVALCEVEEIGAGGGGSGGEEGGFDVSLGGV